jgi:aspartyl-tRNA(Asn)/glutamyl-tRNA(Gln) amidotransferase subunit B
MFIGVNDGNLEEGSFRCDANVSVRPVGQKAFGTRTEIKNVNSFRFVQKAIEWEIADQIATLSAGGRVEQYTKTWDDASGRCNRLRKKEGSDDYRYFPEPDLPPIELSESYIDGLRAALPELPAHRRARYVTALGLPEADARVLTEHPGISAYFEALTARSGDARRAANWVSNVLKPDLRTEGLSVTFPVSLDQMCALFSMLDDGSISSKIAKDLYAEIHGTDTDPKALADAKGLKVITDVAAIEAEVRKVLDASERQVAMYRSGKKNLAGYFKGEVMKATRGRVDPKLLDTVLLRLLDAPA